MTTRQQEGGPPPAKERGSKEIACRYVSLGLLDSRTIGTRISAVFTQPVCGILYGSCRQLTHPSRLKPVREEGLKKKKQGKCGGNPREVEPVSHFQRQFQAPLKNFCVLMLAGGKGQ